MERAPEIVREANRVTLERRMRVSLEQRLHQETLNILRQHGDEIVGGAEDDHVLKNIPFSSDGTKYTIDLISDDTGSGSVVFIGFKSAAFNRLLAITSDNEVHAALSDCTYEGFLLAVRQRGRKKEKALQTIALRRPQTRDLRQFKELVRMASEAVAEREGQPDLTCTHGMRESLHDVRRTIKDLRRLEKHKARQSVTAG